MTWTILQGDCVDRMREMPEASVDAVVCDPPYGLEFMGKAWDAPWKTGDGFRRSRNGADVGRDSPHGRASRTSPEYIAGRGFQDWCEKWAREALRVLKPGGYMIAAGGSRTFHRLVAGVEDAGFEIRDCITWLYGSGFPKSLNVSEALRSLPACACDVPRELGTVDAGGPAGTVGAGVGAEPGAVPLAEVPADGAGGVGPDVGAHSSDAIADVNGRVEQVGGDAAPVVLGSSAVAGVAAGDEVAPDVGGVEVDPEALRDDVVRDRGDAAAVEADGTVDDVGADGGPADPLVLPLPTTPGGVPGSGEATPVRDGHAVPPAVDGDALPVAAEVAAALDAGELGHDLKCDTCGGIRGHLIPEGLGTALKPAAEFWTVARKPLTGTVAQTFAAHGTGALHIDATRIASELPEGRTRHGGGIPGNGSSYELPDSNGEMPSGRWPANVVLSHSEGCVPIGTRRVKTGTAVNRNRTEKGPQGPHTPIVPGTLPGEDLTYADADGLETVTAWECVPGCPVRMLDEQTGTLTSGKEVAGGHKRNGDKFRNAYGDFSGTEREPGALYGDSGGASRFFYVAKASSAERNAGLDGFEAVERRTMDGGELVSDGRTQTRGSTIARNVHPTVKPIELMRWLIRLVTPPGGTVLDPFLGSGTTGCAAVLEGVSFIGIEREAEYVPIAEARIRWWAEHPEGVELVKRLEAERDRKTVADAGQVSMFDLLEGV